MADSIDDERSDAAPREGVTPFMRRFAADESGIFIILFAISSAIWITLILASRRKS